jgi:acetyl esterase/lipase
MDAGQVHLVVSAIGALNTVNAYRPLGRRGPFAVLAYIGGWPTSELPLHVLGLQVILTAVALPIGILDGTAGALALGLSILSWLGLIGLYARGRRAEAQIDAALVEGLGPTYLTEVSHPREVPADGKGVARRPGVVRMLRAHRRYAHDADISYGDAGKFNLLDVWRRPDVRPGDRAPVLLQIPGGAWVMGNKQGQAYPLLSHMVERGWVCVSISYRLSPRATWPAHVIDVKKALAWIKTNIVEYGGDPEFVAVTGGSAGGHLASLTALTWDVPAFQPGFEDADTRVAAAVPYYGVYDWSDEVDTGGSVFLPHIQRTVLKGKWSEDPEPFRAGSPLRRVRPDAPPFFVIWGRNDTMVTPKQPRTFVPRLRSVSQQPVVAVELPDAQHGFDVFSSPRAAAAAEGVGRFLGVIYGRYRADKPEASARERAAGDASDARRP